MSTQLKSVADKNSAKSESLSDAQADLAAQIDTIRAELAALAKSVGAVAGTGAEAAKTEVARRAVDLGRKGEATAREAARRAEAGGAAVTGYVRKEPMIALAAAAGTGLLLGLLSARRR